MRIDFVNVSGVGVIFLLRNLWPLPAATNLYPKDEFSRDSNDGQQFSARKRTCYVMASFIAEILQTHCMGGDFSKSIKKNDFVYAPDVVGCGFNIKISLVSEDKA